jgi:hypothetical protein
MHVAELPKQLRRSWDSIATKGTPNSFDVLQVARRGSWLFAGWELIYDRFNTHKTKELLGFNRDEGNSKSFRHTASCTTGVLALCQVGVDILRYDQGAPGILL